MNSESVDWSERKCPANGCDASLWPAPRCSRSSNCLIACCHDWPPMYMWVHSWWLLAPLLLVGLSRRLLPGCFRDHCRRHLAACLLRGNCRWQGGRVAERVLALPCCSASRSACSTCAAVGRCDGSSSKHLGCAKGCAKGKLSRLHAVPPKSAARVSLGTAASRQEGGIPGTKHYAWPGGPLATHHSCRCAISRGHSSGQ